MFADVEKLVIAWLAASFPDAYPCAETPADPVFTECLPIIEVTRIGGSDTDQGAVDQATIDVECYAADRNAASVLADNVRAALRNQMPGFRGIEGSVLAVDTLSAPAWRPYDNTDVRRFGATYRITVHALT
jgi:hypothetical protein